MAERKITLAADKQISWYVTAQSGDLQHLEISSPSKGVIVKTSLLSKTLSNFSIGSFGTGEADEEYTIKFEKAKDVRMERLIVSNPAGTENNIVVYAFATEDGGDKDYNDLYLSITQYAIAG